MLLVHNFYPYAEQQPNRGHFTKLYSFLRHPIQLYSRNHISIYELRRLTSPRKHYISRAYIIYSIGGGLSISPSPTPSACDRSSDCYTIPKPYRRTWYRPILVSESTYIGRRANLYRLLMRPIQVNPATNIGSHHPLYEGLENAPIRDLFPFT